MGKLRILAMSLTAVVLVCAGAWAQVGGRLAGTVNDSSKSVIPGATVTVTNAETGISREVVSDAQGRYVVNALPPARYNVSGSMTGFKTTVQQGITVNVGGDITLDLDRKSTRLNSSH